MPDNKKTFGQKDEIERLESELAEAQSTAKVLWHCYENDNRPPMFAGEYCRKLPTRFPFMPWRDGR